MSKPTNRNDLFWGYAAQALNISAGIILLPVILHYLSPADVGLWFVFLTIAGLTQLLEFGFQPSISRNISYIYSGATSVKKTGVPERSGSGEINLDLLADVIDASRKIYRTIALIASATLGVAGGIYICSLLTPAQDLSTALAAWLLFAAGYVITFYYGYINAILLGRGDTAQNNKVIIISRLSMIAIGTSTLIMGNCLIGLGYASLVAAIIGRYVAYRYYKSETKCRISMQYHGQATNTSEVLRNLWHNAKKLGIAQLGAFLIQKGNILIASSFLGLEAASKYSISVTILLTLSSVSAVICNVQIPYISHLQVKRDKSKIIPVYGEITFVSWLIYISGFITLYFAGPPLLSIIGSKTQLLPPSLLLILGLVLFLEMNHSIAAIYLTTTNHVPFVLASILSGLGTLVLSLLLVDSFQLLGLIMAQGVVQAAYNNWKWPMEAKRDIGYQFQKLAKEGVATTFAHIRPNKDLAHVERKPPE